MEIDQIRELANQAAQLIPHAPPDDDVISWLSWRELVWDAARRLGELGGSALAGAGYVSCEDISRSRVSPAELLGLATQFRADALLSSGSALTS